jgi:hypothetical protein
MNHTLLNFEALSTIIMNLVVFVGAASGSLVELNDVSSP